MACTLGHHLSAYGVFAEAGLFECTGTMDSTYFDHGDVLASEDGDAFAPRVRGAIL